MGKFIIRQGKTGYRFCLCAGNGQTVAVSEVYTTLSACRGGIACVRRDCVGGVEEPEGEILPCPKFEIFRDKAMEYRFRLKSKNGEIIAVSEGYKTKISCKKGIASVKKNAPFADEIQSTE